MVISNEPKPKTKPRKEKASADAWTAPRMGAVYGLSGIVGIAIPMMDHKYISLGFGMCWAAAFALSVVYFPQWKIEFQNLFLPKEHKTRLKDRDHLVSPIFMTLYILAPIFIYFIFKEQRLVTTYLVMEMLDLEHLHQET